MPKKERLLLAATVAAALVLRALAYFRYRFDSDEQQHLHVAWGWTAGLLPYRDVFDNHAPLFHLITAPILALFGERSDILLWMRLPMLLLFGVVVWATYVLGRRLYDARVGMWAAALLALFPPFFLKSLEFRTDNLWNAWWMLALVVLAGGLTTRRMFVAGLLLGLAFATSLKTSLLLVTLGIAALLTYVFVVRRRTSESPLTRPFSSLRTTLSPQAGRGATRRDLGLIDGGTATAEDAAVAAAPRLRLAAILAFAVGFAIVPLALAIFFAARGVWDDLVYCVITFNGNVALTRRNLWIGRAIFPFTSAGLVYVAWRFRAGAHAWRYFFAVAIGVFTVVLAGFWVLISPRDFLALMPLLAIFAAAFVSRSRNAFAAFACVVAAMIGALWYYADRFENNTDWHVTMMDQALRLSHPGELLMDVKGETIYRQRPSFYAFENITRAQMARGILRDTVPEDVVARRAYVAQADGPMWPPRARAFLSANFLNMGRLRAAGQWIRDDGSFTIAIPGEYAIVVDRGEARGTLDGTPYIGSRLLAAGKHRFVGEPHAAVMWAPAFRRGHSPFHLRDREFGSEP